MDHEKEKTSNFDVLEMIAKIFGQHGKSDEEIKEMLEYHFPISSAVVQRIMEARKNKSK